MNEKYYDIAFAVNDGYVMPLCVALQSIAETSSARFKVHILYTSLSAESMIIICRKCKANDMNVRFHNVTDMMPQSILHGKYGRQGVETMMRFLLPQVLSTKKTVLYLDCDLIAVRDITSIFAEGKQLLNGNFAAAVVEDCTSDFQLKRGNFGDRYFNAGVMLINLEWWRTFRVKSQAFEMALTQPDLPLHDQDILNIILRHRVLPLSKAYNAQNGLWWKHQKQHDCRMFFGEPFIVHFTGPHKPWKYTCCNPYRTKWLQMYKHTFGTEFKQRRGLWGLLKRLWYKYSPFVKFKEQYFNIK